MAKEVIDNLDEELKLILLNKVENPTERAILYGELKEYKRNVILSIIKEFTMNQESLTTLLKESFMKLKEEIIRIEEVLNILIALEQEKDFSRLTEELIDWEKVSLLKREMKRVLSTLSTLNL